MDYISQENETRMDGEHSETPVDFRVSFESEEWRPVVGFETQYEVSSLGRIRSLSRMIRTSFGKTKRHRGRVLTPCPDKDGYPKIILRVDGKYYTHYLHRLVALAFHGDKRNILHREVDHIDANPANAHASNLRWVSKAENMARRRFLKVRTDVKLSEDAAREIKYARRRHGSGGYFARKYGVDYHVVHDIWRGRTWKNL